MVRHRQPASLYSLTHAWVCSFLGDRVVNTGYDSPAQQSLATLRTKLRPFFLTWLPASVRTSLLEDTASFLLAKSLATGVDCDYGKSVLHLLYLLLSADVRRLKVTLCCYYGCRDLESVLQCIKKNGSSLEHLELARSSLLRMDPLRFRNVLSSATRLHSLVVRNIASDAMLKLIGAHCTGLQVLVVANSKQVTDIGVESLCCQVTILDRRDCGVEVEGGTEGLLGMQQMVTRQARQEFSAPDHITVGCTSWGPAWRSLRSSLHHCLGASQGDARTTGPAVLVEVKQVLHPICGSLRCVDITDTSITNVGLAQLCRQMGSLTSLGEYSISDSFLRSLAVVSSMKIDRFPLVFLHTRKVSYTGMYNLVHVFSEVRSLACWEPLFDIADLAYLPRLSHITLIRIRYSDAMLGSIIHYFENCRGSKNLEKVCLEFIVQEQSYPAVLVPEFDVSKIFHNCDRLKVFTIEFKDSLQATPSVGYSSYNIPRQVSRPCFQSLRHVQFGQMVQNSVISVVLQNCPQLVNFHANNCPALQDRDLAAALPVHLSASRVALQCLYIYEAPHLTLQSFNIILESCPNLRQFGNLSRWAVDCEGIQQIVRTIRNNNLELEILCGSHWFQSTCAKATHSGI